MQPLRAAIRDLVDRSIEIGGSTGHGTVVITAGTGVVQWLAEARGVFDLEVGDSAGPQRRTPWQRMRRRAAAGTGGFTERDLALLAGLGFVAGDPYHELRPDEAGLDRDHVVHIITTVLHDIFRIRDPGEYSADIF